MLFRCELLAGGYTYDVTDDLVNWEDVELAFKREDYDGVVRSFSTKFEFSNRAYSLLVGEYLQNYLQSSASIVYYTRNNSWLWNEVFRCALDYSTFSYSGTTCEINAVDDSLAALIKAKKGTQYEYAVSGMKEAYSLRYDGLLMSAFSKWEWQGTEDEDSGDFYVDYSFNNDHTAGVDQRGQVAVYMLSNEFPFTNRVEAYDGGSMSADYGNGHTLTEEERQQYVIFKNISDEPLTVHVKLNMHLHVEKTRVGSSTDTNTVFYLSHTNDEDNTDDNYSMGMPNGETTVLSYEKDVIMKKNDEIMVWFRLGDDVRVSQSKEDHETDVFEISTTMRNSVQRIDVVKPVTLLNRLLQSMNGGNAGISGSIASGVDTRLDHTFLLAAESIRGLEHAKIYSSYTQFCNWMSAEFGFVPVVDDSSKKVSFVHRDSLFKDTLVKDMGDECTDFQYEVDDSLIYSRLRVGYDRVDYDSVNGRDEWRFTTSYTTGVTLTDNSLELISPYRADAYGIEFLSAKRGEDTTDDDSDTDVFMVGARQPSSGGEFPIYGTWYEVIRGGDYAVEGVLSPETMFNVMYSQRYMIEANQAYIGVSAKVLEYASSDGNSEVTVGGKAVNSDVQIASGLFSAGKLSFTTGDLEKPADLSGYLAVEKNGKTYKGYVQSASYNYGKDKAVKYELIVKEVTG